MNLDVSTLIAWTSSITNGGECEHYDVNIKLACMLYDSKGLINFLILLQDSILNEQAKQETENHLLPVLLAATEGISNRLCSIIIIMTIDFSLGAGKEMYACQTAADSFRSILETVGGPGERKRGE